VTTFDNRGASGSDKPDGAYTTATMAADTIGLLDGLGITRAHVLGHSLGGYIAQEVALARPDLVTKLILAATTTGGPNVIPITAEALQVMTDRSGDPLELFRRGVAVSTGPGFAERHPDVVEALWAYRASNPVPPPQYAAQVMAGAQHNAEARLGNIRCPTLILFGAEDKVVPPGNAELLAQKIRGAQVKILPGLGHHIAIEDPETVASIIIDFLKSDG
jgi:pimeloyl-ACP methyl ester carboxylesterase